MDRLRRAELARLRACNKKNSAEARFESFSKRMECKVTNIIQSKMIEKDAVEEITTSLRTEVADFKTDAWKYEPTYY
eukprot:jgi/Bigna1/140609/aug1.57_g15317